jgi:hypothetical protein
MYRCQRCDSDVTAEVEAEIQEIVSGPAPMSLFGSGEYFQERYVCRACESQERASGRLPTMAGFKGKKQ